MLKTKKKICPPHKYRRRNLSRDKTKKYLVFKCMDCPHYVKTELAVGAEARCYKCDGSLVISARDASEVAKPICVNCRVKSNKTKATEAAVDTLLEEIFKDL